MCSFFPFHTIKWYAINVCNCLQWVIFLFALFRQFKKKKCNKNDRIMFKSWNEAWRAAACTAKRWFLNHRIIFSRLLVLVTPDRPDNAARLLLNERFCSHAVLTDHKRPAWESSRSGEISVYRSIKFTVVNLIFASSVSSHLCDYRSPEWVKHQL